MKKGYESNLIICPKCKSLGTLRLKDQKTKRLVITHYDKRKYKTGKAGGTYHHYFGSFTDESIEQLWKIWVVHHETEYKKKGIKNLQFKEKEFKENLEKIRTTLHSKQSDKWSNINWDLNNVVWLLTELRTHNRIELSRRRIRKYKTIEPCPSCKKSLFIECAFVGELYPFNSRITVVKVPS